MAWRAARPIRTALALIRAGVERVVEVTDDEVEDAMRAIYEDTHNVAEGRSRSRARGPLAGARSPARHDGRSRPDRGQRGRTVVRAHRG